MARLTESTTGPTRALTMIATAAISGLGVAWIGHADHPWERILAGCLVVAIAVGSGVYLSTGPAEEPTPARGARRAAAKPAPAVVASTPGVPASEGQALYMQTCPACHGPDAKGRPGLGKDMTTSEFIASKSDAELVEFIKQGRAIDDPLNTTGVPMPPMGANPALSDGDLLAIVQFIRSLGN